MRKISAKISGGWQKSVQNSLARQCNPPTAAAGRSLRAISPVLLQIQSMLHALQLSLDNNFEQGVKDADEFA